MEIEQFKELEVMKQHVENQRIIIKNQEKISKKQTLTNWLVVCFFLVTMGSITFCCFLNLAGSRISETKTDFRFYNLSNTITDAVKIIKGTDKIYNDTYDGKLYVKAEEYNAAKAKHPEYKRRSFIEKCLKLLSKGL